MKQKYLKVAILTVVVVAASFLGGCTSNDKKVSNNSSKVEQQSVNSENDVQIHFIDTGNSDAILIKGEKTVLIDGGDNDDEELMVSYLEKQSIKKIDYMISSHAHADHLGGLDNVIKNINVENLLVSNGDAQTKSYKDFINAAADKKLAPSVPLEGVKFELGKNEYMQIYNTNGGKDTNEQSLIVLYTHGKDKFLFNGDAEKETEIEVLKNLEDVDVLKVGHHGSRTSTSDELLNKVKPEYAVITVASDNKYNHPHREAMQKLENKDIKVHRSDECGDIVFSSTGNGVSTSCEEGSYMYRDKK